MSPFSKEFLKQSSTRILFIADKITSMTLEIYRHPSRVVEEASANGLRHVGYGVPTEMFPPFVSAAVETPPGQEISIDRGMSLITSFYLENTI